MEQVILNGLDCIVEDDYIIEDDIFGVETHIFNGKISHVINSKIVKLYEYYVEDIRHIYYNGKPKTCGKLFKREKGTDTWFYESTEFIPGTIKRESTFLKKLGL